jgi:UDP-N-acetylglucosamine transferase subunit ALG13
VILLTVGTEKFSFHRLVEAFDELAAGPLSAHECFAQIGPSKFVPRHCTHEPFISFDRMRELVSTSELVITHAGAGSTLLCFDLGVRPIAVPRLGTHGEHVDDHQLLFAERMAEADLLDCVTDLAELGPTIERRLAGGAAGRTIQRDTSLVGALDELVRTREGTAR